MVVKAKMPKYPKNFKDVEYYVRGRKKRVTGSTKAISDLLASIHKENPTLTVWELRELITDRNKYILFPDAVEVLDAHIKIGYGDYIPDWK